MRSGFVSFIGRPNVGKSTLLNAIVNQKIAITSNKPQTTRNIIQGIYHEPEYQIVFVDTPGIHKPMHKLGKVLNKQASSLMKDIDAILFVVDAKEGLGKGDKFILSELEHSNAPVILVLNKIDRMDEEHILKSISDYKDLFPFAEIVPVSALKKDNIDRLIEVIKKYLTDDVRYFDDAITTSSSIYFRISEFVREKVLLLTEQEVPHRVTCVTSHYEEKDNIIDICVDIIVDRDALKRIIIGKGGALLKEIGSQARKDIEEMLGRQVYLELYVKTIPNWRDKERYLADLGFME